MCDTSERVTSRTAQMQAPRDARMGNEQAQEDAHTQPMAQPEGVQFSWRLVVSSCSTDCRETQQGGVRACTCNVHICVFVYCACCGRHALDVVRENDALRRMPRADGLLRSVFPPSGTTSFAPTDFHVIFRPSVDRRRCLRPRFWRPKSCL